MVLGTLFKTHERPPKLMVAGVDFLPPWLRLQEDGLSLCHQPPVLPQGSSGSLTLLGQEGKPGSECEQGSEGAWKGVTLWGGWWVGFVCQQFSGASLVCISIMGFFHPESLCQAYDKTGLCVFLLSLLEKLRYSRQICPQLLPLSQRGGSKPQPLMFQHEASSGPIAVAGSQGRGL